MSQIFHSEVWIESPSLPDYEVSSFGRVRRKTYTSKMPKGGYRTYGGVPHYGQDDGKRMIFVYKQKSYKVHTLVNEAFNGPKPFKTAVTMHDDEDYHNNTPGNLKWGTQKENLNYPGFIEYCKSRVGDRSPGVKGRNKWKTVLNSG